MKRFTWIQTTLLWFELGFLGFALYLFWRLELRYFVQEWGWGMVLLLAIGALAVAAGLERYRHRKR